MFEKHSEHYFIDIFNKFDFAYKYAIVDSKY